jgi:hypothetical protein
MLSVTGDTWEPISVSLAFHLSGVSTTVLNTPVEMFQGVATDLTIETRVVAGPNAAVRFEISPTQLYSGITIAGNNQFFATDVAQLFLLKLQAASDAPGGETALALDRFFNNTRTGFFVPLDLKPFDAIQKIRQLSAFAEPTAITFKFNTDRLSRPVITLWRRTINHDAVREMVPANQVAVACGGPQPQNSHSIRVTGLPVGQALWFRIDADVEQSGFPSNAFDSRSGETGTLQRVCLVRVAQIKVLQAGGGDGGRKMATI